MRDDDPEDLLHETFIEALLTEHPLGRPVLGTEKSITAMSRDRCTASTSAATRCRGWCSRRRATSTHAEVLGHVAPALARPARRRPAPRRPPARRPGRGSAPAPRLVLHTDDTEQAHLMLGVPRAGRHDERRWALSVLNAALGGGMSSRLFQEVRERRGLAY